MGLFDKLKKLSSNLSAEKVKSMLDSVNTEDISKKITSVTSSLTDKVEEFKTKIPSGAGTKTESSLDNDEETVDMTENDENNEMNYEHENTDDDDEVENDDVEDEDEEDEDEDNEEVEDDDVDDEDLDEEDENEDEEEDYDDEDRQYEDDEELKAKKKERNKKIAKGVAKGAMFVGSFLWAQREGADSETSILHAFNKTKEVDDLFDGDSDDDIKKEKKEKKKSNSKTIKAIAHYEYICPKNRQPLNNINISTIEIPTVDGNGCPTSEEAIKAIMDATGLDKSRASSIWNGGDSLAWHKVSYTSMNNGKRGMTVKCK